VNLEEYRKRLDRSHTFTGVPSYWEALQEMTAQRDRYQYIAKMFYDNRFTQDAEQLRYATEAYEKEIYGE
jgi:hypothetical protein